MSNDIRKSILDKHPEGYTFDIVEETRNNRYSVTVQEEIGRGGSCIVYRGTVEKDMGLPLFDGSAVIKEFYPKKLAEKGLRRSNDGISLDVTENLKEDFDKQKEHFCKGQVKHIYFAGMHFNKALSPASYSGTQNGTFYSVSDVSEGEVLSNKGRNSFTIIDALKLTVSICDVIGTLHRDTIQDEEQYEDDHKGDCKLYLDCKPSNIFVDGNNNAYLFDFDTVQPIYRYEFSSYSEGWGAPEQKFSLNEGGYKDIMKIGFHTDMYSVGAVLLWLLVGIEGPTEKILTEIENGFDWKNRITLTDTTNAKENENFIDKLDNLMRKLLKENAEERKRYYPDEHSANRTMADLGEILSIAESLPIIKSVEEGKNQTIAELHQVEERLSKTIKSSLKQTDEAPSSKLIHYNIPFRNDWFTGRQAEIETIENNFANGAHIQIIHGMGGMGKSQIAKEYLYRNMNRYNMIQWISVSTMDGIIDQYKLLLKHVNELQNGDSDVEVCQKYFDYLRNQNSWLIVYDGCDYYTDSEFKEFTQKCLPKDYSNGSILITSRNNRPIGKSKRIEINKLSEDEAVAFLLDRTEETDEEGARQLAKRVGCFPLALEVASAFIAATPNFDFCEYLECLEEKSQLLDQTIDVTDYDRTLTEIILNTFELIKKNCDKETATCVIEIMKIFAFLSPNYLSLNYFTNDEYKYKSYEIINYLSSYCKNKLNYYELNRILVKYSLLTKEPNDYYSMHGLQQEVIRKNILTAKEFETYRAEAYSLVFINYDLETMVSHEFEHLHQNVRFQIEFKKQQNCTNDTVLCLEFLSLQYEIQSLKYRVYRYSQIDSSESKDRISREYYRNTGASKQELLGIMNWIMKCTQKADDLFFSIDTKERDVFTVKEYVQTLNYAIDICIYGYKQIALSSTLIIKSLEAIYAAFKEFVFDKYTFGYGDLFKSGDGLFLDNAMIILVLWMLCGFKGGIYYERMRSYCSTMITLIDRAINLFDNDFLIDSFMLQKCKEVIESFIIQDSTRIPKEYLDIAEEFINNSDYSVRKSSISNFEEYEVYRDYLIKKPVILSELYQELTDTFSQDFANLENNE